MVRSYTIKGYSHRYDGTARKLNLSLKKASNTLSNSWRSKQLAKAAMKKKVAREVERQGKKIERKAEKKAEKKHVQDAKKINRNAKTAAKRKATREVTREASSSPSFTTEDGLRTPEKRKRLVSENVISADASSSFNSNTVRRLASSLLILTTLHTITLHRSL